MAYSRRSTYDVAVIGLGYVGLPTALAFFAGGLSVLGIDVSADRLISVGAGLADLTDADRERSTHALIGRPVPDDRRPGDAGACPRPS